MIFSLYQLRSWKYEIKIDALQKYHNYIKHIKNEYKYILLTYLITIKKQGTKSRVALVLSNSTNSLILASTDKILQNKAKWFAKQLASLVYQCKAKVLEFPSKKSDTLSETNHKTQSGLPRRRTLLCCKLAFALREASKNLRGGQLLKIKF